MTSEIYDKCKKGLMTERANLLAVFSLDTEKIHCKKRLSIFPSPAGMSPTKSPWPGRIKLFPTRESLVVDIPAGDGKIIMLFYSVLSTECVFSCVAMTHKAANRDMTL
jgi:hypothetical protein